MKDFERECQDTVNRIAAKLQKLYEKENTELEDLEELLNDLMDSEPDDELSEDYEIRLEEWNDEVSELEEKIENLKEEGDLRSYFDDYLDVKYVVDSQKRYRSAIVTISCGGPNIYVDTEDACVKLYWGTTYTKAPISYSVRDAIDEIFEEQYDWD